MNILRWFMSHPIIAAWTLAGLAIVLNLGSGGGSDKKNSHVVATEATTVTDTTSNEPVVASSGQPEVAIQAVNVSAPVATSAPIAPVVPVAPSVPVAPVTSSKPSTPETPVLQATAPAKATEAPVAETAVPTQAPTKVTKATAPVVNTHSPASVTADPMAGLTANELLQQARLAFKHQAMDKSVAFYQYLIKKQPQVIDYKGELGNVFFHQKKLKEAAAMYADIALPLIKQGKSDQVSNMLGFIGAFYPEKATEISKHLIVK